MMRILRIMKNISFIIWIAHYLYGSFFIERQFSLQWLMPPKEISRESRSTPELLQFHLYSTLTRPFHLSLNYVLREDSFFFSVICVKNYLESVPIE